MIGMKDVQHGFFSYVLSIWRYLDVIKDADLFIGYVSIGHILLDRATQRNCRLIKKKLDISDISDEMFKYTSTL